MSIRDSFRSVFDSDYCGADEFIAKVIKPIFGEKDVDVLDVPVINPTQADEETLEKANIQELLWVATVDRVGTDPIQVFDVTLGDSTNISRARVGIQRIIRSALFPYSHAFIIFHYRVLSGTEWRFSYVYKQDKNANITDAKRFTYLFSRELHARTAIDRFEELANSNKDNEALLTAFNVEALSDEFFEKYRAYYAELVKYITGKEYVKEGGKYVEKSTGKPNAKLYAAFGKDDKAVRDYVKKLMGRITFLHFLQRKGWMNADKNFMLHLFEKSKHKADYMDKVLEPLFFGILNTKVKDRYSLFKESGWDVNLLDEWKSIPYLNGGLFEQEPFDCNNSVFPKDFFARLFQFFSEYNFTVDENDPDDAEVGVDPEMLGKIFENLLEDNKDKGAFYTPKEIVRYMCRESLIAYLLEKTGIDETVIRDFVTSPYEKEELMEWSEKEIILTALENVKICDPAIGSGAFPMGLLNELVRCEEAIILGQEKNKGRAELKKAIIKNNIYGVDIEKGAVDIARLRFWLSLVVDEEEASPLPNLDYKIMQGNSLLESYKEVDLSHLLDGQDGLLNFGDDTRQALKDKLDLYYVCEDHSKKKHLQADINDLVHQQIIDSGRVVKGFESIDVSANQDFFLWHTWFSDVFNRGAQNEDESGFDIVIGNPPYLESRSPEFSDSLKNKLQNEVLLRRPNDYRSFPRGADLLIYFYELSLRLLNKRGYNVFITENAWLSTDYGKQFQDFLRNNCEVHAVIDSDYKYFETADINTVITLFRNKEDISSILPVSFFHCKGSLEDFPCNTYSAESTERIVLKRFSSDDVVLINNKWSVVFCADEKLLDILNRLFSLQSESIANRITIGQGLNITKKNIIYNKSRTSIPYYTSDMGPTYSWEYAKCYVPSSVASASRQKPLLILPRGLGTHFCSVNNCEGYTSSYVEIYGNLSVSETLSIWLFCNSSLLWLLREITGRTNLGGGMLKAEASDLKSIPIAFEFNSKKVKDIYSLVKGQQLSSDLMVTLNSPEHKAIDSVVFEQLGLDNEKDYIIDALINIYYRRIKKSQTK